MSQHDQTQMVLDRLRVVTGGDGKKDQYWAFCPAHSDQKKPSLSVRRLDDRVLIHCHAGCDVGSVVHAIGLSIAQGRKTVASVAPVASVLK